MLTTSTVARTGLDAIALKPAEFDVSAATSIPAETFAIDYEGREYVPEPETLAELAADSDVYVTTPVRADGFDPLGDDSLLAELPDDIGRVLVAGHPAYLTDEERARAVAPRLGRALEADPDAWVGTENVERIAMATGATQYELLSETTHRELRALRSAGFADDVSVYAPTVLTDDEDAILDAVGAYVARRDPVEAQLPTGAPTDSSASGRAREVLLEAIEAYALAGDAETIREQTDALRETGATTVVGYPARGLDLFTE